MHRNELLFLYSQIYSREKLSSLVIWFADTISVIASHLYGNEMSQGPFWKIEGSEEKKQWKCMRCSGT